MACACMFYTLLLSYDFDSTGALFQYFLLAFLSIILIPATFSKHKKCTSSPCLYYQQDVYGAAVITQADKDKQQRLSRKHKQRLVSKRNGVLIVAWFSFIFLINSALTTTLQETRWDPYEILGLSTSATLPQIKKAFRKLSLQFHPDKILGQGLDEVGVKEAEGRFVDVSKAHKVLTNEEAKGVFDEFGHPDGKQSTTVFGVVDYSIRAWHCTAAGIATPSLNYR